MSRELIKQLKALKHDEVKPSDVWLKNNREILLSQIKNTISPKAHPTKFNFATLWQAMSVFLPSQFVYSVVRPVVVLLLIVSMGVGSWIATVDASSSALPGDWLYPAKRAAEKTQVAVVNVVGDKSSQTKVHVELAKKRVQEVKQIVKNPSKKNMIANTVKDLKNEINTVNQKLDEIKGTTSGAAEAAKNVTENAQEIKDALKEAKTSLLVTGSATGSKELAAGLSEVKDLAKDTAVKAVEVMVSKHLQGDTSVSKEEVKQAISTQLDAAVKDAAESQQNTEDVNKVVSVVNSEVKEIAREARGAEMVSSTKVLSTLMSATAKQTQDAVNKTQLVASTTDQKASEAQQFITDGNLQQAIDAVKLVVDTARQVGIIADNTMQVVQNVLPVVSVVSENPVSSSLNVFVTTTQQNSSIGVTIVSVSTTVKITTTSAPILAPATTTNSTVSSSLKR